MRKKYIFIFLLFLLIFSFSWWMVVKIKEKRKKEGTIKILVQSTESSDSLQSMYLAELLELSMDKPTNIYDFNEKEAKEKLLKSPLIKTVEIKKIKPSTIYVEYCLRTPVAWLYDLKNIALDKNGYPFPIYPFLPPKNLPEIYLGENLDVEDEIFWLNPISSEKMKLALDLLQVLKSKQDFSFKVKRIDVANAFAGSYGKREIVLLLEHNLLVVNKEREVRFIFPRILRLTVKEYSQQLGNYFVLHNKMIKDYEKQLQITKSTPTTTRFADKVIDMRILKLAFIDE